MRKVVFPVAGLGTRFLPATKAIPKEMLPVVDRPLIQYATDEAIQAGAHSLIFVTSRAKHALYEHFDRLSELERRLAASGKHALLEQIQQTAPESINRAFVPQPEALGLGHAILCARDVVGEEAFGIILPDDMIYNPGPGVMAQMAAIHAETGCSVIAVEEVPRDHTSRYGIVSTEPHGERTERLKAIVEKPDPEQAPSNLAVVGRYLLTPRIMQLLAETRPGAGGEIQLTDAIARLIEEEDVLCYRFQGTRYDCGSKFGFAQANIEYGLRDAELRDELMDYLRQVVERR